MTQEYKKCIVWTGKCDGALDNSGRQNMGYGVVTLEHIDVQEKPSFAAERGTQLLLNEIVEILGLKYNDWIQIRCMHNQDIGWIGKDQIRHISKDEFDMFASTNSFVNDRYADFVSRNDKRGTYRVSLGTPLHRETAEMKFYLHSGDVQKPLNNGVAKQRALVHRTALHFLGVLYAWGGRAHVGVDCSGLVQIVYRFVGIEFPHSAQKQSQNGQYVLFNRRRTGDLAFFKADNGTITHVGIVFPDGKIIHAKGFDRVRVDTLTEEGIFDREGEQTHTLAFIRRVIT